MNAIASGRRSRDAVTQLARFGTSSSMPTTMAAVLSCVEARRDLPSPATSSTRRRIASDCVLARHELRL